MNESLKSWLKARLKLECQDLRLGRMELKVPGSTSILVLNPTLPNSAETQSAWATDLVDPPSPLSGFTAHFYKSAEPESLWAELKCETPLEDFFDPQKKQRLQDFCDTLLPALRFRDELMTPFAWLDERLSRLVSKRSSLNKESWSGLYLRAPEHLELGPFRGFKTEHHIIPMGRGLCGQAASTGETIVADDVKAFSNYLSCSPLTRSEIVIPLKFANGFVWGELDLDSAQLAAYDSSDRKALEGDCLQISRDFESFLNSLPTLRSHFDSRR